MSDIEEAISYIRNTETHLRNLGESWYADYLDDAIELLEAQQKIVLCRECKKGCLVEWKEVVTCDGRDRPLYWFCADGRRE